MRMTVRRLLLQATEVSGYADLAGGHIWPRTDVGHDQGGLSLNTEARTNMVRGVPSDDFGWECLDTPEGRLHPVLRVVVSGSGLRQECYSCSSHHRRTSSMVRCRFPRWITA